GYLARHLRIESEPELGEWQRLVSRIEGATGTVTIGIVGKYVHLRDSYLSVIEALSHGGFHHGVRIELKWVASDHLLSGADDVLAGTDGILVPGGFGWRGVDGKLEAIRFAREQEVPYLGHCL